MKVDGTLVSGSIGNLRGQLLLATNGNGSGVLSATFFSPKEKNADHISKIVPESVKIFDYADLIEAVVLAGFEVDPEGIVRI